MAVKPLLLPLGAARLAKTVQSITEAATRHRGD
jgi:hypothetical protein